MNNFIVRVLIFLSGKKSIIATLLALINGYLFQMNMVDDITFYFIGAILVVLFGTASVATAEAHKSGAIKKMKALDEKISKK